MPASRDDPGPQRGDYRVIFRRTERRLRRAVCGGVRRLAKILGWTLGILLILAAAAAAAVYAYVTSAGFRGQVEARATGWMGRKTTIEALSIDWGVTTRVRLDGVQLANAPWAREPAMLRAERIDFEIRLLPLLRGRLDLPSLVLLRPEIAVERNEQDRFNWQPGEAPAAATATREAVQPDDRFETPLIGRLEIAEGNVRYRDPRRKLELDGTVSTATGRSGEADATRLALQGKLEGRDLRLQFAGGSIALLRDSTQPWPVELEIAYGATKLDARGTVLDPFKGTGIDIDLVLSGHNLADIYPLLGIPGPPSPPYRIAGKLGRHDRVWTLNGGRWRVGDSDLTGDVQLDDRAKPARLGARLVSQKLVFADLAPLAGVPVERPGGATPRQPQGMAGGGLFPDTPLEVEKLRAMTMDVALDARRVIAPSYLPIQALSVRVVVENGVATAKPLAMVLLGDGGSGGAGRVEGDLVVDARAATPRLRTALALHDVELRNFFRGSRYFDTTYGKLQGRVVLAGAGRSLAQIMAAADGHVAAALAGGSVSSLMVSLAGLQIFDALILYVTGDHRIPIRCAAGRLDIRQGMATFDRTLLDTQKSVLRVQGQASLASQTVRAEIDADAKQFDLLDLHGAVIVHGTLRQPQVALGRIFPLPTPVVGTAKDVPCAAVTQQVLSGP